MNTPLAHERIRGLRRFVTPLALASGVLLSAACGSSGDADPIGALEDSITISDLTGIDNGPAGSLFKMDVAVVTTGDIPANQITYTWEQTAGPSIIDTQQSNGNYRSTFTFRPIASGQVTIRVTARTASGKQSAQAKTVSVSPAV